MSNVPEKDRDTTGGGRATDPRRNNHLGRAGCVSRNFSPVRLGFASEAAAGVRTVQSGCNGRCGRGRGGKGRSRDCGAVCTSVTERPEAVTDRSDRRERGTAAVRPRGIQSSRRAESVPSAGWLEVADRLSAVEGMSHE